jgi:Tfp pilus assembly protein PilO
MTPGPTGDRRGGLKAQLIDWLHEPLGLRIAVVGAILLAGYGGVYTPLSAQIGTMDRKITREQKLAVLAEKLEQLQMHCKQIEKWLPKQTDNKEWMQYMLDGIRKFPLKLVRLDFLAPRPVGPYQALVMRIEVEGSYFQLDQLLRWLETNPRLLRVDDINIGLAKQEQQSFGRTMGREKEKKEENRDNMVMGITVLGLGG